MMLATDDVCTTNKLSEWLASGWLEEVAIIVVLTRSAGSRIQKYSSACVCVFHLLPFLAGLSTMTNLAHLIHDLLPIT
jgi:hypothetical protein